jgi:HNH endonuclease
VDEIGKRLPECRLVGCYDQLYSLGLCSLHYQRWSRHGTVKNPRPSLQERLFSKLIIDSGTGCLLWTGTRQSAGYGHMYVAGRGQQLIHRLMWELLVGPIPEALVLDHLCRVRHCASIAHLEVVTFRKNILRGIAPPAVNTAKTHCSNGHEFDLLNTRFNRDGSRTCRACHRDSERRRRAA